jgi:hypothetical protein
MKKIIRSFFSEEKKNILNKNRRILLIILHTGNQCGYGVAEKYPYLYFNELSNTSMSVSTYACVSKCP